MAQCRRDHNRLGFAYQVGFVRLFNRLPAQQPLEIEDELLQFISVQVNLDVRRIEEYAVRQHTVSEHQLRVRAHLGRQLFGPDAAEALEAFLFEEAFRLEHTSALQARAETFLLEQGILHPAESTLVRVIGEQRRRARQQIFAEIAARLPADVSHTLDELLQVRSGGAISGLQRIKATPSRPSPEAMLSLIEKLAAIEATGVLQVDLSWLNSNYQRTLYHAVKKSAIDRLRRMVQPHRQAAQVCFLWQSYRDTVDQMIDMYDKLLLRVHGQAQNELDEQMKRQRQSIQGSLGMLKALGEIILDEAVDAEALRERLYEVVPREQLAARVEDVSQWVSGVRSDLFYGVVKRFGYLRRFSSAFLEALEFRPASDETPLPCLEALQTLTALNADNKRKLPEEAPVAFLPGRLQALVRDDQGRVTKQGWECALLLKLRDEIKAGNLCVTHSKRFGRFDDFFLPPERWHGMREASFADPDCRKIRTPCRRFCARAWGRPTIAFSRPRPRTAMRGRMRTVGTCRPIRRRSWIRPRSIGSIASRNGSGSTCGTSSCRTCLSRWTTSSTSPGISCPRPSDKGATQRRCASPWRPSWPMAAILAPTRWPNSSRKSPTRNSSGSATGR